MTNDNKQRKGGIYMKIEDCKTLPSCEWCDPKTIPLFYAECVRATIDDESQLISVSYCPNCGRRLRG